MNIIINNKKKRTFKIVVFVAIATLIGVVLYLTFYGNLSSRDYKHKQTLYVDVTAGILGNGSCDYYQYSSTGTKLSLCIFDRSNKIGTIRKSLSPRDNTYLISSSGYDIVVIVADVHTETISYRSDTPTGDTLQSDALVIDKVYTTKLQNVHPTNTLWNH